MDFYLTAFQELQYDRQIGMAAGPIPWSAIDRWAQRHNVLAADEFQTLLHHIRAMENAVALLEDKKSERKNKRHRKE